MSFQKKITIWVSDCQSRLRLVSKSACWSNFYGAWATSLLKPKPAQAGLYGRLRNLAETGSVVFPWFIAKLAKSIQIWSFCLHLIFQSIFNSGNHILAKHMLPVFKTHQMIHGVTYGIIQSILLGSFTSITLLASILLRLFFGSGDLNALHLLSSTLGCCLGIVSIPGIFWEGETNT